MELRYTCCDVCNPGHYFRPHQGRGLYMGTIKEAKGVGWKAYRDGSGIERHICLECQEN